MGDIKQVGPKAVTAATGDASYVALADATAFTPTFPNLTIGNGSVWGYYQTINDVCYFSAGFIMGSTSSVGGAIWITGLPETSSNNGSVYVKYNSPVICNNGGSSDIGAYCPVQGNTTGSQAMRLTSNDTAVNATTPFSWATNYTLTVNGSYPIN